MPEFHCIMAIQNQSSKVKILIVEDEILLAMDMRIRLEKCGYEVAGIASSVEKALQSLIAHPDIDIALIDIILQGEEDGIDFASHINEYYKIPFIFLTSHADHLLVERAKTVQPYAYMLKPFDDRGIQVAIELALANFSKQTPENELLKRREFSPNDNRVLQVRDSLFLKKDYHFQRVYLGDIKLLEADNNYTNIYTKSDKYIYSTVLKKIEEKLPHQQFLRVHRSYVVNIQSVNGFEGNMLFVGEKRIPVSKPYRAEVFRLFRTI